MDRGTRQRLVSLTLALVLVTPLSIIAARWQWSRHLEREALNAAVIAAETAPPVSWHQPLDAHCVDACEWQRVTATGTWLPSEQVLVRKQVVGGTVGFSVMTPFLTADGTRLYTFRGWTEFAEDTIPPPPTGEVTVLLRLRHVMGEGPMGASDLPAGQLNRIVPSELAGSHPTVDALFELLDPVPDDLVAIPWPELTSGPHLSYFVQWILIGLTGVIVYVRVFRSEIRIAREPGSEPEPAEDQQGE